MMWGGAFPEPLTFSIRALRVLAERAGEFDVVHDNQGLGYGMLGVRRLGLPLVTSIHHPISVDRRIDLASSGRLAALNKRRWYGFVRMQARVARRLAGTGPLITVSESSRDDICRDFRIRPEHVRIIPLGVDTRIFRPRDPAQGAGPDRGGGQRRLADQGDRHAAARGGQAGHRTRRAPGHRGQTRARPPSGWPRSCPWRTGSRSPTACPTRRWSSLLASAEMAVVPSLYEGFSLPAVEHMASGTPLVASRTGALPEVTGDAAVLVAPGEDEELAAVLRRLHHSPAERDALADRAAAPGPGAVRLVRGGRGHRRAVPGRDGRAGHHEGTARKDRPSADR